MKSITNLSGALFLVFMLVASINLQADADHQNSFSADDHLTSIVAGDVLLPNSISNKVARAAYSKALDYAGNAKIEAYFNEMDKAIKADPKCFSCYAHIALAHTGLSKNYEDAAVAVDKALAIPTTRLTNAEKILRKVLVSLDKKPDADPAAFVKELTVAYPDNAQAHEMAAFCSSRISGNADVALAHTVKLTKLRPDYAPGYNMLGYMYMAKEDMPKAEAAFNTYIRKAPREANPYDSKADFYMKKKDYAKAAEHYSKAVSLGMDSSAPRAKKAITMIAKDDLAYTKKAIEKSNQTMMMFVRKGNAAGIANLYTIDGKFMAPNAKSAVGKEAIRQAFDGIIKTGNTSLNLKMVTVWGDASMAVEEGTYTLANKNGAQVDEGKYLVVWKNVNGKWKMFRDIFNSDFPPANATARK